jgi:hypothetical protein
MRSWYAEVVAGEITKLLRAFYAYELRFSTGGILNPASRASTTSSGMHNLDVGRANDLPLRPLCQYLDIVGQLHPEFGTPLGEPVKVDGSTAEELRASTTESGTHILPTERCHH